MAGIGPCITARKVDYNAKSRGEHTTPAHSTRYVQLCARLLYKGENRMILTLKIVFRKIECIHQDYLKAHGITALVLDG